MSEASLVALKWWKPFSVAKSVTITLTGELERDLADLGDLPLSYVTVFHLCQMPWKGGNALVVIFSATGTAPTLC